MANQQLVDYIKSQLAAGVTKVDLQKAVNTAGWSELDSNEAFMVAEGKAPAVPVTPPAPVTPKPAAPAQPVTAAQPAAQPTPAAQPVQPAKPAAPVQQPVQPSQPMQQPVASATPAQPISNPSGPISTIQPNLGGPMRASTMQMNVQATTPRRHTVLWASIVTIVVLIAAGAAAYNFLPPVQEVVNFYLQGGQTPTPVDLNAMPVDTTSASTTQADMPVMPAAPGTTTATTSTQTGTVASTTASTTIRH